MSAPVPAAAGRDFERARESFLAGLRAYQAGDFNTACGFFEASLAALPGRVSTLVNLAATRLKLGEPERALALLEQALAQEPGHADAQGHRGTALAQLGRDAEALVAFDQALGLAARDGTAIDAPLRAGTMAQRALSLLALGRASEALAQFGELPPALADRAETHWHRGRALQALERHAEAEAAYRRAVALDPQLGGAWGHLGGLLKDAGRRDEAIAALRQARELEPDEAIHGFQLAALGGGEAPAQPPEHYVRALFDGYADDFDQHLVHTLHYRTPERVAALLAPRLAALGHSAARALDLGCGTGLMGAHLASMAKAVEGVDLSPRMLALAARRGLYTALHEAELVAFLRRAESASAWGLIAAADVLNYFGDLAPVMDAVNRALAPGGLFAFSVEWLPDDASAGRGWALRSNSRYAHSRATLMRLAAASALRWLADERVPLREEQGRPVEGLTVVLQRPGA